MRRPLLLPALHLLWRDEHTIQLGVDPARAVVLTDIDKSVATMLQLLDGRHTIAELTDHAASAGMAPSAVSELLAMLSQCGAVVDGDPTAGLGDQLSAQNRRRLAPDLAALSLSHGSDAGAILRQRATRSVVIDARGRVGPTVASLLAASGVGRVHIHGSGKVTLADSSVGGLTPDDEHRPYTRAASDAVHRAAPEANTRTPGSGRVPDLIVLAGAAPSKAIQRALRRVAHLPISLRDGTAVVGPLVIPGKTACLGCVDAHRLDRDPVWPALAAQLTTASDLRTEASHISVVAMAAALAAMQILCHLDGGEPEAAGRSLEITGLGQPIRRRTWAPHPRCSCVQSPAPVRSSA